MRQRHTASALANILIIQIQRQILDLLSSVHEDWSGQIWHFSLCSNEYFRPDFWIKKCKTDYLFVSSKTVLLWQGWAQGLLKNKWKHNVVAGHSQYKLMWGKSCLINLISVYGKVTHLVDQRKPIEVIFLDFSSAFNTVPYNTLMDKISSIKLDNNIIWRLNYWLTGWDQRVLINGLTSGWQPVTNEWAPF